MKKITFTILFGLIALISNAQIYNTIKYYDKFDDVIKTEKVKTLITETDSTWIFETKGRTPKVYYYLNYWFNYLGIDDVYIGNKNKPENLVNNVYGCERRFVVSDVPVNKLLEIGKENSINHMFILVHRVISRYEYVFEYDTEYHWIQKNDGSRIIYSNDE